MHKAVAPMSGKRIGANASGGSCRCTVPMQEAVVDCLCACDRWKSDCARDADHSDGAPKPGSIQVHLLLPKDVFTRCGCNGVTIPFDYYTFDYYTIDSHTFDVEWLRAMTCLVGSQFLYFCLLQKVGGRTGAATTSVGSTVGAQRRLPESQTEQINGPGCRRRGRAWGN